MDELLYSLHKIICGKLIKTSSHKTDENFLNR